MALKLILSFFISLSLSLSLEACASSDIAVSPMFLKIAKGGSSEVVIKNNGENNKTFILRIVDESNLAAQYCSIDKEDELIRIASDDSQKVLVNCQKNRLKESSLLEIMYSDYEINEIRRVVLY